MTAPKAFVMGHPIAHSRSPMLHGYWLKQYGIPGSYERLDIPPEEIPAFFKGFRAAGWAGGNVTVPHKTAVIPFLDRIDPAAKAMGAVNTLWWDGEALVGGNTDAQGFIDNLDEAAPGWADHAGRALVLGAGGAARAAVYGLLGRGFTADIANRTPEKAQGLADHFGKGVEAHGLDDVEALLARADLLVNATSLGMSGKGRLDLPLAALPAHAIVYDVVYVPLETELLRAARARGLRTVDGLGMLLHQAGHGFAHWFGRVPEVSAGLRAVLENDIRASAPAG